MATYGQVRMRLSQMFPAVPLDLLDGWIWARHESIMDQLNWDRLATSRPVSLLPEYTTGTVTLTQGLPVVVGNGTAWDSSTGDVLRIEGGKTYYRFIVDSAAAGTLDRPYEGDTGTFSYRISRAVYTLPADVRLIKSVSDPATGYQLSFLDRERFRQAFGDHNSRGNPTHWTGYFDSDTDPPLMQIEVFPLPITSGSVNVAVVMDKGGIMDGETSTAFLPWERSGVIQDGVAEDCCTWLLTRDNPPPGMGQAAERYARKFADGLAGMIRTDISRHGSVTLQLDQAMYQHRLRRWQRYC